MLECMFLYIYGNLLRFVRELIFFPFVFIWFKCAKCIKLWCYLIDRLMNWTEDGSVIESTKQIMTEQKYTFQRKMVQHNMNSEERKKKVRKITCLQRFSWYSSMKWRKSGKFYFQRNFLSSINSMSKLFNLFTLFVILKPFWV